MNWLLFAISLFVAIILEMSMLDLVAIAGVRPSVIAILALFVTLWAPRTAALWACFICGLMVDLTSPLAFDAGESAHLRGPNALGFLFAAFLILQVRSMVMRREVFATATLAGVFVLAASIVVVALYTVRSWYSPELAAFSSVHELLRRAGMAVYTAAFALPLGWLLLKTSAYWHFPPLTTARTSWR